MKDPNNPKALHHMLVLVLVSQKDHSKKERKGKTNHRQHLENLNSNYGENYALKLIVQVEPNHLKHSASNKGSVTCETLNDPVTIEFCTGDIEVQR